MALNERGHEVPDPTPVEWPAGVRRPETLTEQIQRMVRVAVSQQAAAAGMETFEEADDFDIEDEDGDPTSPYELTMMQEESRMVRDASDLERRYHERVDSERTKGIEQSRVAGSEIVSEVRSSGNSEVARESAVGKRESGVEKGRAGD